MATKFGLRTFSDLVSAVREELGHDANDTTITEQIKRDLNMVYLHEVVPASDWPWLKEHIERPTDVYFNTGTANVTQNSPTVTLTESPAISYKGYWFGIGGQSAVYRVLAHTANTNTLTLETPYLGSNNTEAGFRLWKDYVALPADTSDVMDVGHAKMSQSTKPTRRKEFNQIRASSPRASGYPEYYTLGEIVDPDLYEAPSGLPATATRAASGLTRTIKFAATLGATEDTSLLRPGDKIEILNAGKLYDGEWVVSDLTTTDTTNDTITYTAAEKKTEAATADTDITVRKRRADGDYAKYRELLLYPAEHDVKIKLNVEITRDPQEMIEDDDEPLMPIKDRVVLLYGALSRQWVKSQDPDLAQRNDGLYGRKLADMEGRLTKDKDFPTMQPSRRYLRQKRRPGNGTLNSVFGTTRGTATGSDGGGSKSIKGTADRVTVFDSNGEISSSDITTTELGYLDGVTSNIQTQLDGKTTGPGSSTDNAVVRWDGTSGGTIQDSSVLIDDLDAITGVTALTVDNINIDGNSVISTDTDGDINLTPDGTGNTVIKNAAPDTVTANHVITADSNGVLSSEAQLTAGRGGTGQDFSASTGVIKVSTGTFSAGTVDLSSEVTGTLAAANGGTGGDSSAATGIAKVSSGTWSYGNVDLSSEVTGTLPAANGGTGQDTSSSTGVAKVSSGTWSVATIVDADVSASAAITKTKLATGTANRVEVTDGSGNLTESVITDTELTYLDDVEELTTFAMSDNQASAANVATWAHASYDVIHMEYSLSRGSGNVQSGRIMIATDGTSATFSETFTNVGTLGVTFSVDVSGSDVRLRYTSTSTGTAPSMKYKLHKWAS